MEDLITSNVTLANDDDTQKAVYVLGGPFSVPIKFGTEIFLVPI